jgi:signal transduction histidine kinase
MTWAVAAWHTLDAVSRVRLLARTYGFDLLIVLGAIEGAVEAALRDDTQLAPWQAASAVALVVLPLLGRRQFPFAAPVAVWLLAAAFSFVEGRLIVFTFSVYAAGVGSAFLLGNLRNAVQARIGLAIVVSGAAIVVYNHPDRTPGDFIFIPALFVIAWLGGFALRARAAQAEAAEQRAARAEWERESAGRIAVAEERARITRELHDIVAHAVSVMVLQVGAVRHKLPEALAEDKDALRDVEQAGRAALAEMRRLLGAMRDDRSDLELAPQPALNSLDTLIDKVRRAGLPVRLHVEGNPFPLPRAIDLSAYRIVQEGLTNSLKHAGARHADVTVHYRADGLQLEVRDDGVGVTTSDGLGHGLVGIRERVKIYGGEMTASEAPGGGFVLSASLPLEGYRP